MDFAPVLAAINATTVLTAIGSVCAIIVLPKVARWGFSIVMGMIPRNG